MKGYIGVKDNEWFSFRSQQPEAKKKFIPKAKITNRIIAGLTHIERALGFLEAAILSEAWMREIVRRALMLEAYHSKPYG
ncbi:MAG: hypothetical protein ACOWYE_11375 [Desulfatiglandales bacterium]